MPDILPFHDFLATTLASTYADYAALPDKRVDNAAEFSRMQTYLLEHYDGMQVAKTILVGNQIFDCVWQQNQTDKQFEGNGPGCPEGTIPVRRITLAELTRFRNLDEFFGKSPGGQVPD